MRKFLLGIAGAAAIGAAALLPVAAEAQTVSITIGSGYAPYGGYNPYPVYRPRPVHYARPVYRHHHHPRRAHPVRYGWGHHGRDCVVKVNRYFDGYSWVKTRRRVCY